MRVSNLNRNLNLSDYIFNSIKYLISNNDMTFLNEIYFILVYNSLSKKEIEMNDSYVTCYSNDDMEQYITGGITC